MSVLRAEPSTAKFTARVILYCVILYTPNRLCRRYYCLLLYYVAVPRISRTERKQQQTKTQTCATYESNDSNLRFSNKNENSKTKNKYFVYYHPDVIISINGTRLLHSGISYNVLLHVKRE